LELSVDPLHEVRVAKRWAFVGITAAVCVLVPTYGLLLSLSIAEIVFVLAPAAGLSLLVIEIASRWEYRMRRRFAYPHHLGLELASIREFPRACQRGVELIGEWTGARAVVLARLDEDEQMLIPVAAHGMPERWMDSAQPLPVTSQLPGGVLEGAEKLLVCEAKAAPWFGSAFAADRVTFVPLLSRDRSAGVLAIAASPSNQQVQDRKLLGALGVMLGLALDNCRLYEGQRAYSQHLQELNRMKSDFLSTVSHELRTPLTSIMMAAEMLLEEEMATDVDSPRTRLVRNIVKGAARLSSLVADLVNVARADEFQPRLELDAVRLSDIINNAVSIIQPLAIAKRQRIDVKLESTDSVVHVDRLRFEQVLINLLSNAQRYSPPGGRICVGTHARRGEIVIYVSDSGPGVPPEDREVIFEPFHRGDRSGLGLGLAIAKSLVELHNGRIWVESGEGGQGSTFCVALPAQRSARLPRDGAAVSSQT
jgi:signal transduction histidine kinase